MVPTHSSLKKERVTPNVWYSEYPSFPALEPPSSEDLKALRLTDSLIRTTPLYSA